jgi:hypothetical protein
MHKLKKCKYLKSVNPSDDLTCVAIAYRSFPLRVIIFGQILASWGIGPVLKDGGKLLVGAELLVEQRGVEPLTSALRIRRPAKT